MNIATPPDVIVSPMFGFQDYSNLYQAGKVQPTSWLFRQHTMLGEAVGIVLSRLGDDDQLEVISAGCSFGPEIDSTLGLIYKYAPQQAVSMRGVDYRTDLLAHAETGKYETYNSLETEKTAYADKHLDFEQEMDEHGINFNARGLNTNFTVALDAVRLRDRYAVVTQEANLIREVPAGKLARLILCNNVIYHCNSTDARAIAVNLAQSLAVGGIVSFGSIDPRSVREPYIGPYSYKRWTRHLTRRLARHGLVPVQGTDPLHNAYQRIR